MHDNQQNILKNSIFCIFSDFFLKNRFQTTFGKVEITLRNRLKTVSNIISRLEKSFKHFSGDDFDEK